MVFQFNYEKIYYYQYFFYYKLFNFIIIVIFIISAIFILFLFYNQHTYILYLMNYLSLNEII